MDPMPVEFEFQDHSIVSTTKGDVEFADTLHRFMQTIHEAGRRCRENGAPRWHYLADIRESTEARNADELWSIAQMLGTHLDILSGRVAIVVNDSFYKEITRMLGILVERYGMTLAVFPTVAEARAWLEEAPTDPLKQSAKPH